MPDTLSETLSHRPHVAHHFDDAHQQKEAATLGMWLFLATEVMLFGAIIAGYIVYRHAYYKAFAEAASHLDVKVGTINTVVLLTSSLMMALAVHAAHHGRKEQIVVYTLLTIVLGLAFLGIKAYEYHEEYVEHLIPLRYFGWRWEGATPEHHARLFFVFYFIFTLIHAIHMLAGMGVLGTIAWMAHKGKFSADYHNPVEMAGLYWHFVDIVWVFLLPTLYLVAPHAS